MSNLHDYIQGCQKDTALLYMPYLTIGDPDFDSTVAFAIEMIDAGAHILELGIPFSDPTADGPVIQAAMVRSLAQSDFSMDLVMQTARRIHEARPQVPLLFLTYLNPVLNAYPQIDDIGSYEMQSSLQAFLKACQTSGIQGLVIPDLPYDTSEAHALRDSAKTYGISQIQLIAPNSSPERLQAICSVASGFIYYVTSLGVTGMRTELPPELTERVNYIKKSSGLPVFAGFGISQADQIAALKGSLDGAIVGSKNQSIIAEYGRDAGSHLAGITAEFVDACK